MENPLNLKHKRYVYSQLVVSLSQAKLSKQHIYHRTGFCIMVFFYIHTFQIPIVTMHKRGMQGLMSEHISIFIYIAI